MEPKLNTFILIISLLILLFSKINSTSSSPLRLPPESLPGKHFVLVHGSCHGAWSWYKLSTILKSSGHNVTSLDLAASGIEPQQAGNLKSIAQYFGPLRKFMADLAKHEKVIIVGHSLGGLAISKAMEDFYNKIYVAVFVTALMPGPSLNISTLNQESFRRQGQDSLMDSQFTYGDGPNNPPTTLIFGPLYLSSNVYQLSPIEDLTLASMLIRPLRLFKDEDMSKNLMLSSEKYGSVNRVFIISDEDKVEKKDFQRWMIEKNPPQEVLEITGSDHMVMMSKPLDLWAHLQYIAKKYC